jgi:hypothetical protein
MCAWDGQNSYVGSQCLADDFSTSAQPYAYRLPPFLIIRSVELDKNQPSRWGVE